jgi:hypothetical protein
LCSFSSVFEAEKDEPEAKILIYTGRLKSLQLINDFRCKKIFVRLIKRRHFNEAQVFTFFREKTRQSRRYKTFLAFVIDYAAFKSHRLFYQGTLTKGEKAQYN